MEPAKARRGQRTAEGMESPSTVWVPGTKAPLPDEPSIHPSVFLSSFPTPHFKKIKHYYSHKYLLPTLPNMRSFIGYKVCRD